MSVTTTTNSTYYGTVQVLRDYELVHTGPQNENVDHQETKSSSSPEGPQSENPTDWPADHRRVPPHRPINYNLDRAYIGQSPTVVEHAFITVMFNGVYINATMAQLWRKTGGRINPNIFKYKIGGEW